MKDLWRRRHVRVVARLLFVVGVAALVAWRVDWSSMDEALHPRHPWILIGAIAANFASVVFKGVAWKAVVDALPEVTRKTRLHQVVSPLFVGFLFNTVLAARVGELVKVMLLRKRLLRGGMAVSVTNLVGTVVAENVVSTIVWVLFVIAIGIFLPLPTYAWAASIALGLVCVAVVVTALVTRHRRPGGEAPVLDENATGLGPKMRRLGMKVWGAIETAHDGLRGPVSAAMVAGMSLMSWFCQLGGIYLTLWAFGLERVGWGGAGLLLVTVTLAQAFPILPGNLLLFQAAATFPLTASYGVSTADAIAFSLVLQFTEVVVGVAFGFVFLMVEGASFGQLKREATRQSLREEADSGAAGDSAVTPHPRAVGDDPATAAPSSRPAPPSPDGGGQPNRPDT